MNYKNVLQAIGLRDIFFSIGNCAFPIEKKSSAMDEHSRDWNMSHATALGARVSQAKLFVLNYRKLRISYKKASLVS